MGYMDVAIVPKGMGKLEGGLTPLEQNQSMRILFRLEEKSCPARIEILPTDSTLLVDETKQYISRVFNYYGEVLKDIKVEWSVEDERIASIDKNGLVKGISQGKTKIFAKVFDVVGQLSLEVLDPDRFGEFTDQRDGKKYKTVKIGNQTWMAENLAYEPFDPFCSDPDKDTIDCPDEIGEYDWMVAQTVCPEGWSLPSILEWMELVDYLGGKEVAGGKMKSTTGWPSPNVGATNEVGFSGAPTNPVGRAATWWTSTSDNNPLDDDEDEGKLVVYWIYLNTDSEGVEFLGYYYENDVFKQCRCLKD
jgi:uncharacterized protein (TIGR02145 family)